MSQSRQVEDIVTSLRNMNNITANRSAAFLELLFIEKEGLAKRLRQKASLDSSPFFDVLLAEHTEAHLTLDRLGAPRTIEGDDFIHDLKIAERIQSITAGRDLSGKPQDVADPPESIADTSTESAAPADNASSPGERDPLVTMDSGAADTCPVGINPG